MRARRASAPSRLAFAFNEADALVVTVDGAEKVHPLAPSVLHEVARQFDAAAERIELRQDAARRAEERRGERKRLGPLPGEKRSIW